MTEDDLLKGVQTAETVWQERHPIPGQKDRAADLALFKGQIRYASGETAVFAGAEVIAVTDKREPFTGHWTVLLQDGSVSNQVFEGEATFKESSGRVGGTGTWRMVGGTGRFVRLRAQGSFTWTVEGDDYRAEFSAASP